MHYSNRKNPDSTVLLIYGDAVNSQGYGQIINAFRAFTKHDLFVPYISDHDFRSSNNNNDIGYNIYVFDIRCQKYLESAHPFKVEFNFLENFPAGIYGYALVLTNIWLA